jgi:hypothetical protein
MEQGRPPCDVDYKKTNEIVRNYIYIYIYIYIYSNLMHQKIIKAIYNLEPSELIIHKFQY